ncbi:MAG: DUF4437 domain-containing protein [Pseudomonadota bacterium]
MRTVLRSVAIALVISVCAAAPGRPGRVLESAAVEFQPLNPARGDASPQAGVLWGDIGKNVPTGAIVKFKDGFSSPPHIHNITYRAVVIEGAIHNDDPDAAPMWMGPGSFWTQPAGEPHITAAKSGKPAMIFLEIEAGPYLVRPTALAFDEGERPVNLEAGNIVWLRSVDTAWVVGAAVEIAFLWGSLEGNARHGALLRFPAGAAGELKHDDAQLHLVVIGGPVGYGEADAEALAAGSYLSAPASRQALSCQAAPGEQCLLYVSSRGRYRVEFLSDRQP